MIKPYDNDVLVQPYDKKWQGYRDSTITISKNYFEHLLNCLANQKYTNELSEDHKKNIQKAIDKAWGTGMFIMNLERRSKSEFDKIMAKYSEYTDKNMDRLAADFALDKEEYKDDSNLVYKWTHLMQQEVWMWANLQTGSYAIIDYEKEEYKLGQVSVDDFKEIIRRRGFTPRITSNLKLILKDMGLGDDL